MRGRRSAGLLPFRRRDGGIEVLIAHPGGPVWARKDAGAWSIVKGEIDGDEDPLAAARREFTEETGWPVPRGDAIELGEIVQKAGKTVVAWAVEADLDPDRLQPGTFQMRWAGRLREFPEIDRVCWCTPEEARRLLNPAQTRLVDRLVDLLDR